MVNPSKAKGTKFETDLVAYLRPTLGPSYTVERLALSGSEDEGDIAIGQGGGVYDIIEAKAEKQFRLAAYLDEVHVEVENFARHRDLDAKWVNGLVVVKRRMKAIGQSFVITTLDEHYGIGL